jgi:(3,5-dihydroxyphenyl)acetyl-CoA 1,2-dioxygenase
MTDISLEPWLGTSPSLTGCPERDVQVLAQHVQCGEALLKLLGTRRERSGEQAARAECVHSACRGLRRRFMASHAAWLYSLLTKDFTVRRSLREVAFAAAECCPGLVPTETQIAQERTRLQCDKEGYEIDQGILFQALLRSQEIGTHLIETALQPTRRALGLIEAFRRAGRVNLGSVVIERQGSAAHLTINNAYCLNAEDDGLVDDLETAVDLALLDGEVRVGVLRGGIMTHPRYTGRRVFSAGINLKALHAGQISFVDFLLRRELGYISKIVRGLRVDAEMAAASSLRGHQELVEKPWLAAVDSFAIGGGAQLLLVFDRVIAAADSYFSLPAAQEGIVPGFSNLRLTRLLGSRKSRQVILFGRKIWAHDPDAQLLFDEVVDSPEIEAAIERNVQQLSSPAVVANRHMLNLADESPDSFLRYAAEFSWIQAERLYSQDVLAKTGRTIQ